MKAFIALASVIAIAGCGKKSSPAPAGAPESVTTQVTDYSLTGGSATIHYKSNLPSATFQCQSQIQGQTASAWADCPATGVTIPVPAGVSLTFSVKAVDPATKVEDGTPPSVGITAQASQGQAVAPSGPAGPTGASGPSGPNAVVTAPAQPPQLTVNGADALQAKSGSVKLTWNAQQVQGDKVMCALDTAQPSDCTTGWSGNLSAGGIAAGSHTLNIASIGANGQVAAATTVTFCAQSCTAGPSSTNGTGAPVVEMMQLGDFYQFTVPPTMHVTEYATTKNIHQGLEFYRILTDPYYLGNYPCNGQFDQRITAQSPTPTAGQSDSFDYCYSTPPIDPGTVDIYKWLTNSKLAYNHLEVATNPELVSNENQDYIDFNMFDANVEYMYGRSRFEQLCLNQHGAISKASGVQFIHDGSFFGGSVSVDFYMCTTQIVEPVGPGLPTRDPTLWRNEWWVGAFFITGSGTALPQYECIAQTDVTYDGSVHPFKESYCGTYANPNLLEFTIVSKTPYPNPADFARDAMLKVRNNLSEIQPIVITTGN